ncbi:ABC transporter ATP-binding protein/permease [bacterium]|nr:ABC transporter ATP-binding protein/permease [bacterium]MCI0606881.1 ABC transporter ATP-binding protein/permease [bacterium]
MPPAEPAPSWKQRIAAFRYVFQLMRMVWQAHSQFTVAMALLRFVRAFVPVGTLWIGKLILDTVAAALTATPDYTRLWKLIALEVAIVVCGEALARASALVESLLGDLFSNHTSVRLMQHAAALDLYQFENAKFYDQLERARRQTTGRISLLAQFFSMGQDILTLLSLGAALLVFSPLLLLLLAIAVFPSFLGETHFASLEYSLFFRRTPQRRRLDYIRYMGASDETAKEVQIFGLAPWLIDQFRTLSSRFYEENKQLSIRKAIVSSLLSLIGTAGYYTAYVVILIRTVKGILTLGSMIFLAGAFARSRDLIQRLLLTAGDLYEQSLYLKDLFDFFEMKPTIVSRPGAIAVPETIQQGFVLENVGYRYPGSERWALRNISFCIAPGERLAFVGENGAGKTTLAKLLARLYEPSEGRILLEGVDLRDYELNSLRKSIGVIFQDFVEYDLPFDQNIGVGEIDRVKEYVNSDNGNTNVPSEIVSAAERSLAASLLSRLPDGYRQMLGYRFDNSVQLSGGEWQKVALARAYMRDAQLLILDEPTAALDARAEYEVFIRFSKLVEGRMAVIISHRFSTVRMADRIIVLNDGKVVEEGTHDQLLEKKGLYAELFSLQAEGYR